MKNKVKKIWFLCLMLILMWSMSGCDDSKEQSKEEGMEESVELEETQPTEEPVKETSVPAPTFSPKPTPAPSPTATPMPEATVAPTPEPTVTPTPEPMEPLPPKEIEYGDIITVSYDKKIYGAGSWNYSCSQEFEVGTNSKQFQNKSEEITKQNVEKSIGKTAGDTFTIWVEEDGGFHGYEYTIVDVKGKNPDIIEYGDKIFTSYAMRGFGVDTGEGAEIHTGNQVLRLANNDEFLAGAEEGYDIEGADYTIKELLGKGIGHGFDLVRSSYEWTHHYKYRIHGISKAVKYGDTIKTEVREVFLSSVERNSVTDGKSTFDFKITGTKPEWQEIEKGRIVFQQLLGKTVGDTVEISLFDNYGYAEIYSMEILSVKPGEKTEEDSETAGLKTLMLADKEEITFIMESPKENGYSNGGWSPRVVYILTNDTENQMTYEYYSAYYSDCHDYKFALEYAHGIEWEYDAEGRVIKEIEKVDWLGNGGMNYRIYEYQYDTAGNCIECVEGYLNDEGAVQVYCITTFQYNEQGTCMEEKRDYGGEYGRIEYAYYNEMKQMIKEVSIYSDGRKYISEYDPTKPHYYCKTTYYDADGNVTVTVQDYEEEYGYDEWGFIIVPH